MSDLLGSLIALHATASATAGDFAAVAATLTAPSVFIPRGEITSGDVMRIVGVDAGDVIFQAFERTATGRAGLIKLAAGDGVDFGDARTQAVIAKEVAAGRITQEQVVAFSVLIGSHISLATQAGLAPVTADECRAAWQWRAVQAAWVTAQNESINAALAAGDKAALVAAIRAAADAIEGIA